MPWFKVDDSFYDHPKTFDAPDCAVALWVRAGTWSARNLTDGFVPAGMPARLCDDHDTAVRELVRRGLWSRTTGGYLFHDWRDYQPTADAVKDLRAKRAEAGRLGGLSKAAKQNGSNGLANASHVGKQNAAPARPDPAPIGGTGSRVSHDLAREPPRQCPEHDGNPNPPPCGPCADARRSNEKWLADRRTRARDAPKCRRHRGQPADNCAWCRSEKLAEEA
ncbi:MAG TPA: hypothetical protein VFY84_12690 [Jiangellales bacterium]|nr:hypothetical protein [Jiangellales bacterium]